MAELKPVAWACFAPNGNIRMWSTDSEAVRKVAVDNCWPLTPLYAHAPSLLAEAHDQLHRLAATFVPGNDEAYTGTVDLMRRIREALPGVAFDSGAAGVTAVRPMHDTKSERDRFEAAYAAIPPITPTKETAWRIWNMARAYGLITAAGVKVMEAGPQTVTQAVTAAIARGVNAVDELKRENGNG